MKKKAFVLWLTGIPGAGKTTLALELMKRLADAGVEAEHLDGGDLRAALSPEAGFTREDRDRHIRRIALLCELLTKHGVACVVSAVSPYRKTRAEARSRVERFAEIHVQCPVEVCEKRDRKGIYSKVRKGKIKKFTGISDPYEPPLRPEVRVQTDQADVRTCVDHILARCEAMGFFSSAPAYTSAEEKELKERLSSLGYLE